MSVRQIIVLCAICVIVVGCSTNPDATRRQKTVRGNAANLGFLQTRNHIIHLETGGKFSILELSGSPIALNLSKTEFRKNYPQLFKDFETAIAEIEAGDMMLDASTNKHP